MTTTHDGLGPVTLDDSLSVIRFLTGNTVRNELALDFGFEIDQEEGEAIFAEALKGTPLGSDKILPDLPDLRDAVLFAAYKLDQRSE